MNATNHSSQRGFALADALLALAAMAIVLMAAIPLMNSGADEAGAKAIADDMKTFQRAALAHLEANRAAYEAAFTSGTNSANVCRLGSDGAGNGGWDGTDTALHTCGVDANWLRFKGAMPASLQSKNAYGEQWVVIHRGVYTAGVYTGGIESLVVSAAILSTTGTVVPNTRRFQVAQTAAAALAGGGGGVVPETDRGTCVVNKAANQFEACGGGWKVNLNEFMSSSAIAAFANRLP